MTDGIRYKAIFKPALYAETEKKTAAKDTAEAITLFDSKKELTSPESPRHAEIMGLAEAIPHIKPILPA